MYPKRNKTLFQLFTFIILSLMISACNEKDLDIEVIETACKDFFIQDASYSFDSTSTCGDEELNIKFSYDGDDECIHLVNLSPRFYDVNGTEINDFDASPVKVVKEDLVINNGEISLAYCLSYPNEVAKEDLNYIQIDMHTENEQSNESNTIGLRANLPGKMVKQPSSGDFEKEFVVNKLDIKINVFDDAAEDGDIISINVNNEWLVENKMIFKAGENISLTIDEQSTNFLLLYAVNEGTSSPNTLAGTIDDGITVQPFNLNLKTGEQVYFKILYEEPL